MWLAWLVGFSGCCVNGSSHSPLSLFLVPFHSTFLDLLLMINTFVLVNIAWYPASTTCGIATRFLLKDGTIFVIITDSGSFSGSVPCFADVVDELSGNLTCSLLEFFTLFNGVAGVTIVLVAPVSAIPMWFRLDLLGSRGQLSVDMLFINFFLS